MWRVGEQDDDTFAAHPTIVYSPSKSGGKLCWKHPFDLKGGLNKAGSFLFKAQHSLFLDAGSAATESADLSDSLIANVGSPAGVVFKGERLSLSFVLCRH